MPPMLIALPADRDGAGKSDHVLGEQGRDGQRPAVEIAGPDQRSLREKDESALFDVADRFTRARGRRIEIEKDDGRHSVSGSSWPRNSIRSCSLVDVLVNATPARSQLGARPALRVVGSEHRAIGPWL
jgi:hypothetical protein